MMEQARADGFEDVTTVLGVGVYALVRRGEVIYVGASKHVYRRIHGHRGTADRARAGVAIPTWAPLKGFVFDQVWVRPCAEADLAREEAAAIARWRPRFNLLPKPEAVA